MRDGHPHDGRILSRLDTQERLLEEHGLTFHSETQHLRGFGRKGQTNSRRTTLSDTRLAPTRR